MSDFLARFEQGWAASQAQNFVDFVNSSLLKANRASRLSTKESYLALARLKLKDLHTYLARTPGVQLTNLEAFEQSLRAVEAETKALREASAGKLAADDALLNMALPEQCAILGIPLEIIDLEKGPEGWLVEGEAYKKPEAAAYAYFRRQGYVGTYAEGSGPLSLMKCACLDYLVEHNSFNDPKDACRRYFEGQCEILSDKVHEIIGQIRTATDEKVKANIGKFLRVVKGQKLYPDMDSKGLMAIWSALGGQRLAEFAETFVQDPYGFRAGWPDLTLAKKGDVRFVEVKTSDKIHASQRDTIREVLLANGANVSVVKLKAKRIK